MCVRLSEATDPETGQTWVVPSDTMPKGTRGAFGRFIANRKSAVSQLLQRPDVIPDTFLRPDYARYMYNVHLLRLREEFETFLAGISKRDACDVIHVTPAFTADDEEPVRETEPSSATEGIATGQCGQQLGAAARRYVATRSFNELDSVACVLTWGFTSTIAKVVERDDVSGPDSSYDNKELPEEEEESRTDAEDGRGVAEDEQDDRDGEDDSELPPFMRIPTDSLEVGVSSAVIAAAGPGGPVRVRLAPCYAVDGLLEAEEAAALRKSFSDLARAASEDGADDAPVAIAVMSSADSVELAKVLWRIRLYLQVDEPPELPKKN
ncbi:MAG: hypothetical protein BJ554DRAFT_8121 [Olpidium bornovanus]|uniref:Uncharacterized protein n=1 Tax=Olpidium bornovanus TaxID=278681 RepID=A0A8H8DM52_9FUNG|nr:MAG: hypothetical protein BJ554DRAFT_8121 [Olpidium bornovanus]